MTNKKFLLAILAIALVLGMTVIGCGKGGATVKFGSFAAVTKQ